jgi:hypothetical protein
MKNIHILPTDKRTRLYFSDYGKELNLASHPATLYHTGQHIYITNDEKPKQGEWSLYQNKIHKCIEDIIGDEFKKIILTTDQDLIKDGVQAIDDELLEWFIENPTCESVEIVKGKMKLNDDGQEYGFPDMSLYKIIIPQEELKFKNRQIGAAGFVANKIMENAISKFKGETLEEAAERIYPDKTTPGWIDHWSATERRCFIDGAQWSQQEILYFLYEELTERRPYSSSKMCEVVIEFIQKMSKK